MLTWVRLLAREVFDGGGGHGLDYPRVKGTGKRVL
jgi:hypothetical protein